MKHTATAIWNGSGKEGKGHLSSTSGVLHDTQYSYKDRFEEGRGTNPEELMAAAHAACFSMKLSFVLGAAGFVPEEIHTTCTIGISNGVIGSSALSVTARVPGIGEDKFQECAREAKENCPVSKALNMEITLEAKLA